MSELSNQELVAIEAVARHFSATWENEDGDWPDAYLMIAGKRVAVELAVIKPGVAKQVSLARPRLRFDRVALELITSLLDALTDFVPDGQAVILTVTAPIRMPSKTTAALEDKIRASLTRGSAQLLKDTIYGNQIRVRFVKGVSRQMSKMIGFVHNPDSDPEVLLRLTESLLQHVGSAADKRAPKKFTSDRWLVVVHEHRFSHIETYRHIHSQLSVPTDFKKILLVLAGGRVETLAG